MKMHDQPYVHVSSVYISAACNRFSHAAHSNETLTAFGSSSFIALWPLSEKGENGISQTLPGHKGLVTCVRFKENENCFLSADDMGHLICWRKRGDKWSATCTVYAHSSPISALAVFDGCIVTGASDSKVAVWQHFRGLNASEDILEEVQRLDLKGKYPLDISITKLPDTSTLIMAVSGTERNVNIFIRSDDKFIYALSLPGHEDWVKSLAFAAAAAGPSTLTLASGSQDGTIRLWIIEKLVKEKKVANNVSDDINDDLLDSFEASLGDLGEGEEGGRQISMKRHILTVKNNLGSTSQYSITFDALLIGHEAGITSVMWRPGQKDLKSPPMLLSSSIDSSIILWIQTPITKTVRGDSASLWVNCQRFGDIGGQRLGGFVSALWTHGGTDVLAHGWAGGWRRWKSVSDPNVPGEVWTETGAVGGHNGPIRGLTWSAGGRYLLTTGLDQTTRMHGNVNEKSLSTVESWHEISRPQVHGYDLVDAAFLSPTQFVSIADEKVARVFEAPQSFLSLCEYFGILSETGDKSSRPLMASVPPLGLSNKALSGRDSSEPDLPSTNGTALQRCPFDGELSASTLWPETEKVFGHGYELHAIAASHSQNYIATACKATSMEHAGIKVYNSKTWQLHGQTLYGHQLTVTRMAFSPDDRYLLSVSRDRSWRIYEVHSNGFVPLGEDKSHTRIIWDCAWTRESDVFATASRDKTVKIWSPQGLPKKQTPLATIKTKEAATALAFDSMDEQGRRLLAIGLENGEIIVLSGDSKDPKMWHQLTILDEHTCHIRQIHRMEWRPGSSRGSKQIASCSEDGTLRIIRIDIK